MLEGVPTALRSEAFQKFLDDAVMRRDEASTLKEEIRTLIAAKNLSAAMPKIARLLELKPLHQSARQLAEQIQQRFVAAAEAKLAEHRYEEAAKILENVPESVQNPRTATLRQRASELAWIAWDLRNGPLVDGTLVAVAGRLLERSPQDPRAAKLRDECIAAQERREERSPRPRTLGVPGSRPPPLAFPSTGRPVSNASPRVRNSIGRFSRPIPAASAWLAGWGCRGWSSRRCRLTLAADAAGSAKSRTFSVCDPRRPGGSISAPAA